MKEVKRLAIDRSIKQMPAIFNHIILTIPKEGIEINQTIFYPFNQETIIKKMGVYCKNENVICFINDKGETCLCPYSKETRKILLLCGYTEGNMFIPLNNTEEITNEKLKNEWIQKCDIVSKLSEYRNIKDIMDQVEKLEDEFVLKKER